MLRLCVFATEIIKLIDVDSNSNKVNFVSSSS